jgi:hypothetical protein
MEIRQKAGGQKGRKERDKGKRMKEKVDRYINITNPGLQAGEDKV